jgi:hypothetical protein
MKGVYDYRGECFGFIDEGKLYDLDGKLSGYVSNKAITSLDGKLVWHRDRDGLYDLHWLNIGYIGSPIAQEQDYDN